MPPPRTHQGGRVVKLVARFERNGQEWTHPVEAWSPDGYPMIFMESERWPWLHDASKMDGFVRIEEED